MPTIFKHTHNQLTATRIALPNVVQAIRDGSYAKPLQEFRSFCATASRDRSADGSYHIDAPWEQAVPRICFAADYLKRQGAMHLVAYNGLVMLEVSDLSFCGIIHWHNTDSGKKYMVYLYKTDKYKGELISGTEEGDVFFMKLSELAALKENNRIAEYLPVFMDPGISEAYGKYTDSDDSGFDILYY